MSLQYFHFETPQKIKVIMDDTVVGRVALGYWLDVNDPSRLPRFNVADGEMNETAWNAYISSDEVSS